MAVTLHSKFDNALNKLNYFAAEYEFRGYIKGKDFVVNKNDSEHEEYTGPTMTHSPAYVIKQGNLSEFTPELIQKLKAVE